MGRKINYEFYDEIITRNIKLKLVSERLEEIEKLKKRIKQLEQELDGIGEIDDRKESRL